MAECTNEITMLFKIRGHRLVFQTRKHRKWLKQSLFTESLDWNKRSWKLPARDGSFLNGLVKWTWTKLNSALNATLKAWLMSPVQSVISYSEVAAGVILQTTWQISSCVSHRLLWNEIRKKSLSSPSGLLASNLLFCLFEKRKTTLISQSSITLQIITEEIADLSPSLLLSCTCCKISGECKARSSCTTGCVCMAKNVKCHQFLQDWSCCAVIQAHNLVLVHPNSFSPWEKDIIAL